MRAAGGAAGLYSGSAAALAGNTQKGPARGKGFSCSLFFPLLSESTGLIVGFGPILSGVFELFSLMDAIEIV